MRNFSFFLLVIPLVLGSFRTLHKVTNYSTYSLEINVQFYLIRQWDIHDILEIIHVRDGSLHLILKLKLKPLCILQMFVTKYKIFEILLKPKINTNMVTFCHGTVYILIIFKRIFFQNVAVMGKTQKVFIIVQNINS